MKKQERTRAQKIEIEGLTKTSTVETEQVLLLEKMALN